MRHRVLGKKLGRDINSRKALLNNLASDLFLNGRIKTTLTKAKFVQGHAEKLITTAKNAKLGKKRILAHKLTEESFRILTSSIAPSFKNRSGGYTRITKLSPRIGDNALMAKLEIVAWDKSKDIKKETKKDEDTKQKRILKKIIKTKSASKPAEKTKSKSANKKTIKPELKKK